ncbi:MAG: hypothetical protein II422_00935 [Prevotella sp.]|jgi:hypothetical protein|nr:hypothetical protein [Prevotella sp.]
MTYYILVLLAIVAGVFVVKKITSCLIKSILSIAIIAILVFLWFVYFS